MQFSKPRQARKSNVDLRSYVLNSTVVPRTQSDHKPASTNTTSVTLRQLQKQERPAALSKFEQFTIGMTDIFLKKYHTKSKLLEQALQFHLNTIAVGLSNVLQSKHRSVAQAAANNVTYNW